MKLIKIAMACFLFLFTSAQASVHQSVTVSQAKKMRDDRHVIVEGKIIGHSSDDDDDYWLEDSTGKIRIDADDDDDDDDNYSLTGKSVRVFGEIDRDDGRVEIDADHIEVMN